MGKYKRDKGLQIPMEQRQRLNAKILYLVENHETELYGITPEDIFNVYMGNGGLHGLDRKDFQNFHAYTEAKKEIEEVFCSLRQCTKGFHVSDFAATAAPSEDMCRSFSCIRIR